MSPTPLELRLGMGVQSADGDGLGKIDRLVLDDARQRVMTLVVHKLLGGADKLVDVGFIGRVDADTVTLNIDADAAKELPAYIVREYVDLPADVALHDSLQTMVGGNLGAYMVRSPLGGHQSIGRATASFFDPAVPANATVSEQTNLPVNADLIDSGTEVVGNDGKKVGQVHEVLTDAEGQIAAIVVQAGFLFKHDMRLPISMVAELNGNRVQLNVPGDQAEAQGERTG